MSEEREWDLLIPLSEGCRPYVAAVGALAKLGCVDSKRELAAVENSEDTRLRILSINVGGELH